LHHYTAFFHFFFIQLNASSRGDRIELNSRRHNKQKKRFNSASFVFVPHKDKAGAAESEFLLVE
jgi:hypothetical protein